MSLRDSHRRLGGGRISIAPMMEWTEESYIVTSYETACALPVHQEI
jgi:hypothetical protein